MPSLNDKKTFSCTVFMDNGETADVNYKSTFISKGSYINEILSCKYKGVDITPIFGKHRASTDYPHGIFVAVENNARFQWEQKDMVFKALGLQDTAF